MFLRLMVLSWIRCSIKLFCSSCRESFCDLVSSLLLVLLDCSVADCVVVVVVVDVAVVGCIVTVVDVIPCC